MLRCLACIIVGENMNTIVPPCLTAHCFSLLNHSKICIALIPRRRYRIQSLLLSLDTILSFRWGKYVSSVLSIENISQMRAINDCISADVKGI